MSSLEEIITPSEPLLVFGGRCCRAIVCLATMKFQKEIWQQAKLASHQSPAHHSLVFPNSVGYMPLSSLPPDGKSPLGSDLEARPRHVFHRLVGNPWQAGLNKTPLALGEPMPPFGS